MPSLGVDADGDGEFAVGAAAEDAVGGRDVGVVAADGGADVAIAGDEVVGGIEADPAEFGRKASTQAWVAELSERSWCVVAVVEVAADVAAGDAELGADQRDHDVGEILADAGLGGEREVDGRVGLGGLRFVVEVFVELLVELWRTLSGSSRRRTSRCLPRSSSSGWTGELAGEEHLPESPSWTRRSSSSQAPGARNGGISSWTAASRPAIRRR